jgi:hypothetical protein
MTVFDCSAATVAPLIAAPPLELVTVPVMVPVPTVKLTPTLARPATVTTTGPVVALDGTAATIFALPQLEGVARTPLKLMVLNPCVAPKKDPTTVTACPANPFDGVKLDIVGTPSAKFRVVVFAAVTKFDGCVVDKNPFAEAAKS